MKRRIRTENDPPVPREPSESEYEAHMRIAALRYYREQVHERQVEILESLYGHWWKAEQMRRFLALLEEHLAGRTLPPKMAVWFDWARRYINSIDPFSDAALRELIWEAEGLAPDPVDDMPWACEEQGWREWRSLDKAVDALEEAARARSEADGG